MLFTRVIYPYQLRESISNRLRYPLPESSGKNVKLLLKNKIYLDLNIKDYVHRNIILNGYHNLSLSKVLVSLGKKGGLMIDSGAGSGYYTALWLAANPNNSAFCFESSPHEFKNLIHNLEKNEMNERAGAENSALGNINGTLVQHIRQYELDLNLDDDKPGDLKLPIHIQTLDEYFTDNAEIDADLLLLNTIDNQVDILEGAENLLKDRRIKHILIECTGNEDIDLRIPKFLAGMNFIMKSCDRRHMHYSLGYRI